ncbi:MAG: nitrogenase [Puniceicoccales bacterium]|jgi:nitrogenase molybdenum-iron protein NifN|nr:nitrogenase [Puniceicoccales bacterium]
MSRHSNSKVVINDVATPASLTGNIADVTEEQFANPATNACKLCTPLGACLAFRGVRGAIPFLHGSQGCATYIRRYLISHFRETMDIAASNFSETSAVFGGGLNIRIGLENVLRQYQPELVGLATTCLSETIGEDLQGHLREFHSKHITAEGTAPLPPIVPVSCASYRGTHADGFHKAVRELVRVLCPPASEKPTPTNAGNNTDTPTTPLPRPAFSFPTPPPTALFPGMVSPADLRELRRIADLFAIPVTILPDYSDTLDGPSWTDYQKLPDGGTPVGDIRNLINANAAIECGRVLAGTAITAATLLAKHHGVPAHRIGLPIGLRESDRLMAIFATLTGHEPGWLPPALTAERGRLIDSWVDGHKYVFEKRAIVYGEEDLVVGLASSLCEIGVVPVLCASGGRSGHLAAALRDTIPELDERTQIVEGADFAEITARAVALNPAPDFLIGSSKGYTLARQLNIPLIRCGFPIHDRIGAQRTLHVGYAGAQTLFDRIANALLERKQTDSSIGYAYL